MARTKFTARKNATPPYHEDLEDSDVESEEEPMEVLPEPEEEDVVEVLPTPAPVVDEEAHPEEQGAGDGDNDNAEEENAPEREPEKITREITYTEGDGGQLSYLLRAVLRFCGYPHPPEFECQEIHSSWYGSQWHVSVCLYEPDRRFPGSSKVMSIHRDLAPKTTLAAGVSGAARRALFALSAQHRDILEASDGKYIPYRESGEAKTYIAPTPEEAPDVDVLRHLLAACNSDLDSVNHELDSVSKELVEVRRERDILAAQMRKDQYIPPRYDDTLVTVHDPMSPPPKRPRYCTPEAHTEDLPRD